MQNHRFLSLPILFLTLSQLNAQTILQEGTVHYHVSRSAAFQPADTFSLALLFEPGVGVLSMTTSQDPVSGTILILDYALGQSRGFLYANGDTTATGLTSLYHDVPVEKQYKLKLSRAGEKRILGYACTYFELTPRDHKKSADRISGWLTDRIKTKARPITDLNNELPGFPLELSLRDGSSGATIVFEADRIAPLDTNLLRAYRDYMEAAGVAKTQAARQADLSFYKDSTVRLEMPVLPGWKVVEHTYRTLYLRHDGLKATLQLQRKTPAAPSPQVPQLEKLVGLSGSYLRTVLHLPDPALETFIFRDQPAVQRIWRYSNGRNYIFHPYREGKNPYDYFPLTDLVELHRAFLMKDVLYELQLRTVQNNYEQVLRSVEEMLAQSLLIGR